MNTVGTADFVLLRKVGDYSLFSPALSTLCSLCTICSIKFKDQIGHPEPHPYSPGTYLSKALLVEKHRDIKM